MGDKADRLQLADNARNLVTGERRLAVQERRRCRSGASPVPIILQGGGIRDASPSSKPTP
jgi:hypothetical protein